MFVLGVAVSYYCGVALATGTLGTNHTPPIVELAYGTFEGTTADDISLFLGVPFANPPYARCLMFVITALKRDILFRKALALCALPLLSGLSRSQESGRQSVMDLRAHNNPQLHQMYYQLLFPLSLRHRTNLKTVSKQFLPIYNIENNEFDHRLVS